MTKAHAALPTYRAGEKDWIAIWREMYDAERNQAETATDPGFVVGDDFWEAQADRFAAAAARSPQPDGFMRFVLPQLQPGDRVIDIGAGSGRYVAQLARSAAEVVAIEPSPAMRRHLEQRAAAEELSNVRVVAGGWPGGYVEECDVAISAHVLYSVREIAPFLEAMHAQTRRACFLYLAIRHPGSFISPFWERFRGEMRHQLPGALECLNVLFQLGIAAQLTLVPVERRLSFADADDALEDIRFRLRFPPEPQRDAEIRAAIDALCDRDPAGAVTPRGALAHAAVVWWRRDG
jgi:SAM-dependent methyltransferase